MARLTGVGHFVFSFSFILFLLRLRAVAMVETVCTLSNAKRMWRRNVRRSSQVARVSVSSLHFQSEILIGMVGSSKAVVVIADRLRFGGSRANLPSSGRLQVAYR